MVDTTQTRKSTKTGGDKAWPFFPGVEFPGFELPKLDAAWASPFEVPLVLRDLAEKGVAQARQGYDRLQAAAEEAGAVAGETVETARGGWTALNQKLFDAAKANAEAGFALARSLAVARTPAEAFELQAGFARAQLTALAEQGRDFAETARRVAEDTAEPGRAAFSKALRDLKVA